MRVIKYYYLALLFVLVGSTFKYGDIFIAPYLIPYVAIFIVTLIVIFKFKVPRSQINIYVLQTIVFASFIFVFLSSYQDFSSFIYNLIIFLTPFLGFFSVFYLCNTIKGGDLNKAIFYMLLFATIFAVIESLLRLSPFYSNPASLVENFYLAKYESPFLFDSNTVAIYLLSYLFLGIYMTNYFKSSYDKKIKILNTILTVCVIFTFSRAAYLALIVFYIFLYWSRMKAFIRYFLYIVLALIFIFTIKELLLLIESDGSGLTKVLIFEDMFYALKNKSFFDVMSGYGMESGGFIYSYTEGAYAHALIPLLVGQIGFLGMIIYFIYAVYINSKINWKATPFLIAFFIMGLSYLNTNTESIFICFSVIVALFYRQHKQVINQND